MPSSHPTPNAEVNEMLGAFAARVQNALGADLLGIYLSGSLALGDFEPDTSDIDMIVVTDGMLGDDRVDVLREMHACFVSNGSPWARKIEVVYVASDALDGQPPDDTVYPQVEREFGFVLQPLEDGWLAQCYTVREHGITLFGLEPKTLFRAVNPDAMRQSVAHIPEMWRDDAHNDPTWLEWLRVRQNQSFVVLTLCRLLYTLERGAVASKPAAARWAEHYLGEPWVQLIERALAGTGDAAPISEADVTEIVAGTVAGTVALVEFTVERFRQWQVK